MTGSRPASCRWFVFLAIALPLLFAWFTNHAWEDYYITLRASRNLAEGNGLVFNPGERVHTFTSPLGVLVPALFTWLTGPNHEQTALWLFRIFSAGLLGGAALLFWRRADSLGIGLIGRVTFFGLCFANARLVDFSINGMETAILVFFVFLLWSELEQPTGPRPWPLALSCAGLLWTRPDGVIFGIVLIVAHVLLRSRTSKSLPIAWSNLIRGILLGGLLYVPWFAWAWWYYGSPIPHTVVAKSLVTTPVHLTDFLILPWRTLKGTSMMQELFMPTYWFFGGWPIALRYVGQVLAGVATFAWLIPSLPIFIRRLSLTVFLGMFYLCMIILFPWYTPPWTALAAMVIAFSLDHAIKSVVQGGHRTLGSILRITTGLIVAAQIGVLVGSSWQMRAQQSVIEDIGRKAIGQWLAQHALPDETLFLEPLGYIGYNSRLKTYDFPGMSSPEVVEAVRDGARDYMDVIGLLHPTWVVLRPIEISMIRGSGKDVLRDYDVVKTWDNKPALDAIQMLPGRVWLEHDAVFMVFRRKDAPSLDLGSANATQVD